MSEPSIAIAGRPIGTGMPAYLVAELSANHNGDLGRAIETIHAAAESGADAIKIQTYTADTLTIDSDRPEFIVPGGPPWGGRTLHDLYREAHTPYEWHGKLFDTARDLGLTLFSTPFDDTAIKLLEGLGAPAYKIASFELVDDALLRAVAKTGKPVVVSTGMASLEDIGHALGVLREAGLDQVLVLRCTSAYPAPDGAMDLSTIPALARATGCPVGLSDHSMGTTASIVAVTLGACLIEKHFTLRRADGGVDSHFSLEPSEFQQLVTEVRRAEQMIGRPRFGPGLAEEGSIVFRRSLYVIKDIRRGERLTSDNVRSIRPGYGLAPRHLEVLLNRTAVRDARRGTPVTWDLVAGAGV